MVGFAHMVAFEKKLNSQIFVNVKDMVTMFETKKMQSRGRHQDQEANLHIILIN